MNDEKESSASAENKPKKSMRVTTGPIEGRGVPAEEFDPRNLRNFKPGGPESAEAMEYLRRKEKLPFPMLWPED